ncbi:TetR/AcrR family transcriptional regulator [Planktosalinus lacus]|uniref:TetR family transcriptional regulator n=1 Tax=Planktosalinus lacus TaxID=1526573 RepID=A0A8J2V993_9FLAO|nr:TetR/AcrR family transcriptional regulator [Planktosalinus lacus]GGD86629.1 TetR family transcriptional regulator [Planktosalinus lacus]
MNNNPRKKEIISKAARLFKKRGYSAVTMRDIADSLNIKAASLYNHINSKQEILATIIIEIAEAFTSGMVEVQTPQLTTQEKLQKIIELHIDLTVKNPEAMACLNNDWMHLEEKLPYFVKMREDYEENFRAILKKGIAQGEIGSRDIEIMLFSMLSTLRTLYIWYTKKDGVSAVSLKNDLPVTLLKGIIK